MIFFIRPLLICIVLMVSNSNAETISERDLFQIIKIHGKFSLNSLESKVLSSASLNGFNYVGKEVSNGNGQIAQYFFKKTIFIEENLVLLSMSILVINDKGVSAVKIDLSTGFVDTSSRNALFRSGEIRMLSESLLNNLTNTIAILTDQFGRQDSINRFHKMFNKCYRLNEVTVKKMYKSHFDKVELINFTNNAESLSTSYQYLITQNEQGFSYNLNMGLKVFKGNDVVCQDLPKIKELYIKGDDVFNRQSEIEDQITRKVEGFISALRAVAK